MRFGKHLDRRDEMEEEGEASQVDAPAAPPVERKEDRREDGDTGCGVEDSRDSEPDQMHTEHNLKALALSIL